VQQFQKKKKSNFIDDYVCHLCVRQIALSVVFCVFKMNFVLTSSVGERKKNAFEKISLIISAFNCVALSKHRSSIQGLRRWHIWSRKRERKNLLYFIRFIKLNFFPKRFLNVHSQTMVCAGIYYCQSSGVQLEILGGLREKLLSIFEWSAKSDKMKVKWNI
jgi:hypothetical protein